MATINSNIILDVNANSVTSAVAQLTSLQGAAAAATGLLAGMGVALAGISIKEISEAVKKTLEWGDAISETAARLGVTTKELQQMQGLAISLNSSVEDMNGSMEKVNLTLGNAELGYKKAQKALSFLDDNTKTAIATTKDQTERYLLLIEGLGQIDNAQVRNAEATKIGGKALADQATAIHDNILSMADLRDEMGKVNIVSDEMIQNAGKMNDEWEKLSKTFDTNVKNSLLSLIGGIAGVSLEIDNNTEKVSAWVELLNNIGKTIRTDAQVLGIMDVSPEEKNQKLVEDAKELKTKLLDIDKEYSDEQHLKFEEDLKANLKLQKDYNDQRIKLEDETAQKIAIRAANQQQINTNTTTSSSKATEQEQFRYGIGMSESHMNPNAPSTKNKDGSYNVGMYQQQQSFMQDNNPGGNLKSIDDQEKALDSFYNKAKQIYGNDLVKIYAAYQLGIGGTNTQIEKATQNGITLLEQLDKITIRKNKDNSTFSLADDVSKRIDTGSKVNASPDASAKDEISDFNTSQRAREQAAKKTADNLKQLQDKMVGDEKSIHNQTRQLEVQATEGAIQQSQKEEEYKIQSINEELTARKKAGTLSIGIQEDLEKQITLTHEKGVNDRTKIEADSKKINDALTLQERKVVSDTASAVQKYTQDTEVLVAKAEQDKLTQIKLANKAAMDAIEQRYTVERGRAGLTATQIKQLETDKANAVKAQNSIAKQEMARSGGSGYGAAVYQDLQDEIKQTGNLQKNMADLTVQSFDTMGNALVDYINGGKASFADFAKSFIIEIEKMIIKQIALNAAMAVMKMVGFAEGGITTSAGFGTSVYNPTTGLGNLGPNYGLANGGAFGYGIQYFADGDLFDKPTGITLAGNRKGVMGEAGPEAIMPVASDKQGNLGVKSTSSSGQEDIIPLTRGKDGKLGIVGIDKQYSDKNIFTDHTKKYEYGDVFKDHTQAFAAGDVFKDHTQAFAAGDTFNTLNNITQPQPDFLVRQQDNQVPTNKLYNNTQQKNVDVGGIVVNVQAPQGSNAQQHGEIISSTVKRQLQEYIHSQITDFNRPGNSGNKNRTIGGGAMSI